MKTLECVKITYRFYINSIISIIIHSNDYKNLKLKVNIFNKPLLITNNS